MLQKILFILLSLITITTTALAAEPLPADKAFVLTSFYAAPNKVFLYWKIAPGYFLYKDKIKIIADDPIKIAPLNLVQGEVRHDQLHGNFESYSGFLTVPVELINPQGKMLNLTISYQGCAAAGFCYPPYKKYLSVDFSKLMTSQDISRYISQIPTHVQTSTHSSADKYTAKLQHSSSFFLIVLSFLGLGLLLAFTPCVLPMLPILSAIIVGHGKKIKTLHAFCLSLSYVLGMSIAYALAGMGVALLGKSLQIIFQNPWVIIGFSGLFILLAISMFTGITMKLPKTIKKRMDRYHAHHKGGTYFSVFLMGAFSTLVVSPCVSAPLVGVLSYIAQTGNIWLGASALLALGFGMGIPLLLFGTTAGKLLPKTGVWMENVKKFFGVLLLALAIWMLSRILPAYVILFLWGALIFICATLFCITHFLKNNIRAALGSVFLTYGLVVMTGAFINNSQLVWPLDLLLTPTSKTTLPTFTILTSMSQLDEQLAYAKKNNKQLLLDFYADWCTSCIAMDHNVFNRADIKNTLKNYILLRADVTKNNRFDQDLLKRFNVIAPPTILIFNAQQDTSPQQIVGEVNAKEFLAEIERLSYHPTTPCANALHC